MARIRRFVELVKKLDDHDRLEICEEASRLPGESSSTVTRMMSLPELLRWQRAGFEVGSHTVSHPVLSRLTTEAQIRELVESKQVLEDWLRGPVGHLAYPNGGKDDWSDELLPHVKTAGYRSAVTTVEGTNHFGMDPFRIKRISIGNDSLPVFAMRISGIFTWPRSLVHGLFHRAHRRDSIARSSTSSQGGSTNGRRRLRIAFIGARGLGSAYSGIERYYEEVGSRLASLGHRVLVYSRSHFSNPGRSYRGMDVIRFPTIRSKHLETFVHTLLATIDVCFRRVDIVQYHALGSSPFSWIPRIAGKTCVVSVRGLDWQRAKWGPFARAYLKWCERAAIRCPNATTVVSKTLEKYFRDKFDHPVKYIPNGVRRGQARAPLDIRRWGLESHAFLLYAGRLSPEKGLETLLEAHRHVASECQLVLAGGSSYSEDYIGQLKRQAGPNVIFTGFQTGRVLEEIYGNALAFVLPSLMEGLSVALLEAMSYGVPVIASDIPENRELVEECGGFLFPTNDVAGLSEVLSRVVTDREEARRIGRLSRSKVLAQFDWDHVARQTDRFFQDLSGPCYR